MVQRAIYWHPSTLPPRLQHSHRSARSLGGHLPSVRGGAPGLIAAAMRCSSAQSPAPMAGLVLHRARDASHRGLGAQTTPPRGGTWPARSVLTRFTPDRPALPQQQQQEAAGGRQQPTTAQTPYLGPGSDTLPRFQVPTPRLSPKPVLHPHYSPGAPSNPTSSLPQQRAAAPPQAAAASTTGWRASAPQQQQQQDAPQQQQQQRGWRRLLQLFMLQVGRALQAMALAFCFLALLLLRPRAAGACSTPPAVVTQQHTTTCGDAAAKPALQHRAQALHQADSSAAQQDERQAGRHHHHQQQQQRRQRHVAVASLGLQPWLASPTTTTTRAPHARTTTTTSTSTQPASAPSPTAPAPPATTTAHNQRSSSTAPSPAPVQSAPAPPALPAEEFPPPPQDSSQQQQQSGGGGGSSSSSAQPHPHPHPHSHHAPSHHAVVLLQGAALLAAQEAAVQALFRGTAPSVVNISAARAAGSFSSLDVTRLSSGQGSGFIWDERGHVVTCFSCVRGAAEVKVTFADASSYTAKLVGADPSKNLAVLRLSMPKAKLKELVPIRLNLPLPTTSTTSSTASPTASAGAAGAAGGAAIVSPQLQQLLGQGSGGLGGGAGPLPVMVGSSVWAVGASTGLQHTLTQGLVSGLGCELPGAGPYPPKGLMQVDAPCAHQAGGVLVNSQGRAVGMLVAPGYSAGGAVGGGTGALGYALPVEALKGLVMQILATGKPSRPTLGVTLAPPQVLAAQGVEGVLVLEVPPGSPAAAAGLRHTHRDIFGDVILGDVIVGLEGGPVRSAGDLYTALDARKAGERVRLDVLRDGKSTSLTVVLGERGQTLKTVAEMDKLFKEVSVKKLYKDCLLLARFYGQRQGNEKVLVDQVRQQFKANRLEVDDDKIKEQKEAAIRALHNLHLLEAERYVKNKKK